MIHLISVVLLVVVCSLYYFPVSLQILPSVNSKMIVAAIGLVFFVMEHLKRKSPTIRKDLLPVLLLGLVFSLSSYFSVVYNSTDDMVFATYFVSMCVWLGGAYCVVHLLRLVYGEVSLRTVSLYLGMMCAGQCIIAVLISNIPALANVVDAIFVTAGLEYYEKHPRLYGIGASFDTAGIRFSCVLLAITYLIKTSSTYTERNFYIVLFLIIGSIGNMISRTTVVGLIIACLYLLLSSGTWLKARLTPRNITWVTGAVLAVIALIYIGDHLYQTSADFKKHFDYGFEGFINFYETGSFSTHSSDLLVNSIGDIIPDNRKTWLIGDGYFADPYDPSKFYMGTDMGYIRLIFYCGLTGLAIFIIYFICCTYVLCRRERHLTLFFICLFIIQLIIWVKIPTDIFCFYALILLSDEQATPHENYQPRLTENLS